MVVATSIQGFQFVQFVPHRFDQDTPAYSVTGVVLYSVLQSTVYNVQFTLYCAVHSISCKYSLSEA